MCIRQISNKLMPMRCILRKFFLFFYRFFSSFFWWCSLKDKKEKSFFNEWQPLVHFYSILARLRLSTGRFKLFWVSKWPHPPPPPLCYFLCKEKNVFGHTIKYLLMLFCKERNWISMGNKSVLFLRLKKNMFLTI